MDLMRENTCKPLILLFSLSFRAKQRQGKEFQRPYNLIKKQVILKTKV